ncbi:MAG: helicase-related protein, partial [Actinomycetota bacterium]
LLVVDEEQRFGVTHKEKIKKLRLGVDVLTMSATPIPRTLEMSLTGIRDLSLINTPPEDRQPILTYVGETDDRAATEAIRRELLREGQVFFVHNRVADIESVSARVRELVPEARVAIAHGQMDEGSLEKVMVDFWERAYDVLVCTTIIESGIDMPTVNTMVVDRADLLGLAQLHQIRGRVGRSDVPAHAYLFYPDAMELTPEARARLSTLADHTELGSGFAIAMRDLEIRGAGNLLGAQQSGHITAVGFDLYCQLLKQSISSIKGEKVKPRLEVQVRLDFLALNAAEEGKVGRDVPIAPPRPKADDLVINIPRETATYSEIEDDDDFPSPSGYGTKSSTHRTGDSNRARGEGQTGSSSPDLPRTPAYI